MSSLRFRSLDGQDISPEKWLGIWSRRYKDTVRRFADDERAYRELIAKQGELSGADFERIGRWKDGAWGEGQWKTNVAMVAYEVWMQAAKETPVCPDENRVALFLGDWSERSYRNQYKSGVVQRKRFGLSRATTLLHFISGGRYPIFDSRVRKAVFRLLNSPVKNDILWYLDSYCQIFSSIAAACGTNDSREIDNALFCYGGPKLQFSN